MQRVTGRLQETVACESRTAGGLLRGEVGTHLLFEENVFYAIFWLQRRIPLLTRTIQLAQFILK